MARSGNVEVCGPVDCLTRSAITLKATWVCHGRQNADGPLFFGLR
jgi:hypothetical protein